jgi:hypothetical protein
VRAGTEVLSIRGDGRGGTGAHRVGPGLVVGRPIETSAACLS